ncbi:hypothetical protein ABT256_16645 [Amycolatopsis japonica]|uniref:hypothetical protein n=1 Tax=Amycolatopsis japonica TaxID=208439 RepID=UPI0033175F09
MRSTESEVRGGDLVTEKPDWTEVDVRDHGRFRVTSRAPKLPEDEEDHAKWDCRSRRSPNGSPDVGRRHLGVHRRHRAETDPAAGRRARGRLQPLRHPRRRTAHRDPARAGGVLKGLRPPVRRVLVLQPQAVAVLGAAASLVAA